MSPGVGAVLAGLSEPLCVGQVVVLIQGVENRTGSTPKRSGVRPVRQRRLDGLEVDVDGGTRDA